MDSAAAAKPGPPPVGREGRARHRKAQPLGRHRRLSAPRADRQHRRRPAGRGQMRPDDLDLQRRIVIAGRGKIRRVARHGLHGLVGRRSARRVEPQRSLRRGARRGIRSIGRQRQFAGGAARRHEARRIGQDERRIVGRQPVELCRRAGGGLVGGKPCALARPVQRVLEGAIQRVELAESLAPEGGQKIEGAIAIGFRAHRQGIEQQAGGTEGRQQAYPRLAVGTGLQAGALGSQNGDLFVDRRSARRRLLAHHREDRRPPPQGRRRRPRPARGARVVHRRSNGKLRPCRGFSMVGSAASGGALSVARTAPAGSN